ncbi:MAG: NAD(P)-dependent oxidoreductase [Chloroflexota bacterium]|nr:NAD(P)-dependent oxidoreductase [Chloroflexota bacterium]
MNKHTPQINLKARLQLTPHPAPERPVAERLQDFDVVQLLHSPEEAQAEAARCLHCPTAPCQQACPLHNDIPRALALLEQGKFTEAAQVYYETSPLPGICGRVCPELFCQTACVLDKLGKPIATRGMEAFLTTTLRRTEGLPTVEAAAPTGKRIAIVGSGPAGLAAAEVLTRHGHAVTVYEQFPQPGGLMVYGIPKFKLELEIVTAKIAQLRELGVHFRCQTQIGVDITIPELRAEYDAILICVGTQEHYRPGLPGEELTGVYEATEFLSRANLPAKILPPAWQVPLEVGPRIHVLGGGSTAMDCLRTALRLPQTTESACYYRRSAEQMPSDKESYRHAQEEGATFTWLASPLEFVGDEHGALTAIRYQRMQLGEPDKSGRRRPLPIPGETFIAPADAVILAFGFRPDPDFIAQLGVATERWGTIKVATRENGQTSVPGIFAAGDVVRGADLLAPAVADALHVAAALEAYLQLA